MADSAEVYVLDADFEEEYRVYEISDLTGFSDYKHFCVVFKKYTGATPTEFIKGSKPLVCRQIGEKNEAIK